MIARTTLVSALLLALGAAACRSADPHLEHRKRLETALSDLAAGSSRDAAEGAAEVLKRTARRPEHFARQRFFAASLMSQAHLAASLGAPFATEPAPGVGALGVGAELGRGAPVPSETAHLVAAIGWAGTALAWAPEVEARHAERVDKPELPSELSALGVEGSADRLRAAALACYARLGFSERAAALAAASPALRDLADARAHLSGLDLDPRLFPWVAWAAHLAARAEDDAPGAERAYRFAIAALQDARSLPAEAPRPPVEPLVHWIESGAPYSFRCPNCRAAAIASETCCPDDGTPTLEFRAEPK